MMICFPTCKVPLTQAISLFCVPRVRVGSPQTLVYARSSARLLPSRSSVLGVLCWDPPLAEGPPFLQCSFGSSPSDFFIALLSHRDNMAYTDLGAAPGRLSAAAESRALLQPSRLICTSCRAHADHASTSGRSSRDSYSYNSDSSTDRHKATIEHVYQGDGRRKGPPSPWTMGWQMNERNLVWNDDLKARLLMVRKSTSGVIPWLKRL